jgi:hypothetical protein
MTLLVVLTVIVIALLIAGLAFYLYVVGTVLTRVATNLEECSEHVREIDADAALIGPGVEHVNRSAGTVAGALPLLYGFAERILTKVSPNPDRPAVATPASGRRRSRALHGVGLRSR